MKMLNYFDVIKAQSGVPVKDIWAQLWGDTMSTEYVITTYEGTLPATLTRTRAGYIQSYKIYGDMEQAGTPTPENPIVPRECGERTVNLFSSTLEQGTTNSGTPVPASNRVHSGLIYLGTGQFTFSCVNDYDYQIAIDYYLSNGKYSRGTSWLTTKTFELTNNTPIVALKIRHPNDSSISPTDVSNIMLNLGSTALPYIPYGYKLPLTSGNTPVDIYIGNDTLSTEEYVDSETGKIYRMVDGTLTPVDPPVPFPQIPTTAGSTTISWAGSGLAPSQVEFEYEKRR